MTPTRLIPNRNLAHLAHERAPRYHLIALSEEGVHSGCRCVGHGAVVKYEADAYVRWSRGDRSGVGEEFEGQEGGVVWDTHEICAGLR